eukprot:3926819-Prymnesium_polylepis.1
MALLQLRHLLRHLRRHLRAACLLLRLCRRRRQRARLGLAGVVLRRHRLGVLCTRRRAEKKGAADVRGKARGGCRTPRAGAPLPSCSGTTCLA